MYNRPIAFGLHPINPENPIKVIESVSTRRAVRLSVWFDGRMYHPLVESLDASDNAVSGRMLRGNVRLISAMRFAESWIIDNIPTLESIGNEVVQ